LKAIQTFKILNPKYYWMKMGEMKLMDQECLIK